MFNNLYCFKHFEELRVVILFELESARIRK